MQLCECGSPAEFGYNIQGATQWFCEQHRLSQNYADARLPKAEQKTQVATVNRNRVATLAELSTAINAAHKQAEKALHDGLMHAIRAGELLLQAKQEVEHGEWKNWLQANVPFQPRTARAYMQLARLDPAKRQRVADLPLREALSAIVIRERRITDAAEYNNRPDPRPTQAVATHTANITQPALPPPTPEEIADELIEQLIECAYAEGLTDADIVAAFERRFQAERAEARKATDYHTPDDLSIPEFMRRESV